MTTLPSLKVVKDVFCHAGQHSTFGKSSGASTNFPDGFPSNFAGGSDYVKRLDFNELGRLATANKLFIHCGGIYAPSSTIASAGYPKGAVLLVDDGSTIRRVVSQVENNHVLPSVSGDTINTTYWKFADGQEEFDGLSAASSPITYSNSSYSVPATVSYSKTFSSDVFVIDISVSAYAKGTPGSLGGTQATVTAIVRSSFTPAGGSAITLVNSSTSQVITYPNSGTAELASSNTVGFLPAGSSVSAYAAANDYNVSAGSGVQWAKLSLTYVPVG